MKEIQVFDIGLFVNSPQKPMLTIKDGLSRVTGGFGTDGSVVVEMGESYETGPLSGQRGPDGSRIEDPTYRAALALRFPTAQIFDNFIMYLLYLRDERLKKEAREAAEATPRPVLRSPDL